MPRIAPQELHPVGAAQFGQHLAGRLAGGKALDHQRAQVPGETFLAQRGGDAADVVGLLKDLDVAPVRAR